MYIKFTNNNFFKLEKEQQIRNKISYVPLKKFNLITNITVKDVKLK